MNQNSQNYLKKLSNTTELTEQLCQELVGGLLHCHDWVNANTSKLLGVTAFSYALSELVIEKGRIVSSGLEQLFHNAVTQKVNSP